MLQHYLVMARAFFEHLGTDAEIAESLEGCLGDDAQRMIGQIGHVRRDDINPQVTAESNYPKRGKNGKYTIQSLDFEWTFSISCLSILV